MYLLRLQTFFCLCLIPVPDDSSLFDLPQAEKTPVSTDHSAGTGVSLSRLFYYKVQLYTGQILTCSGINLDLVDLLEYLMRKPGVVFTRESLLQSVWGWDFDGGSRTVDVHVQTLRQKLGEHASAIETVRGVGYRLAEPSAGDGAEGDDTAATASEE